MAVWTLVGVWAGEGDDRRKILVLAVASVATVLVAGRLLGTRRPGVHTVAPDERHLPTTVLLTIVLPCVVFAVGMFRSEAEWRAVAGVRLGSYSGEARVAGDSKSVGNGRRVLLDIEGQRFETWVFGSTRHRVGRLTVGDVISVDGERTHLDATRERRLQIRHVLGRFEMSSIVTVSDDGRRSSVLVRVANRVRESIRRGAQSLSPERGSLFTGLVYGDDSAQAPEMVDRFRASGLAHLTAVSGQNVVFVLTMFGPLLTRLGRTTRLGLTIVALVWFAVMTRLEPSVVRAVFMAGVSALAIAFGRPVSSWVTLCATVCVATLVDPFLVWSVGWWLSVSGCIGLIVATRPLTLALDNCPRWMSGWIAPTIAAQSGVLMVLVAVFGWPSAMSIPSNLLAAPVAGLVMFAGLPTAVVAGMLPDPLAIVVMSPIGVAVGWVDAVAALGAHLDPPAVVDALVAVSSLGVVLWAFRRASHGGLRTGRRS